MRSVGRLTEAKAYCRRALAMQPKLAPALINLAMIFYQQGKLADALPWACARWKPVPMMRPATAWPASYCWIASGPGKPCAIWKKPSAARPTIPPA